MNVWLVWTGQYSNATVEYVCDSREAAEVVAAKLNDGYIDAEDGYRVLTLAGAEAIESVLVHSYSGVVLDDGTRLGWVHAPGSEEPVIHSQRELVADLRPRVRNGKTHVRVRRNTPEHETSWSKRSAQVQVEGTDEERVRRVYSDTMALLVHNASKFEHADLTPLGTVEPTQDSVLYTYTEVTVEP